MMSVRFSVVSLLLLLVTTTTSFCAIAASNQNRGSSGGMADQKQWWWIPPPWRAPPFTWRAPTWSAPPTWRAPPVNWLPPAGGGIPPGGTGGGCSCSCSSSSSNAPPAPPSAPPKVIIVGGNKKHWSFGYNYTDWARKAGIFYVDDVLEFDYPLPEEGRSNHSVHLLPNLESFESCDLTDSVRVGNEYSGGADGGFKFQLGLRFPGKPYFFACGERNGFHCRNGNMKFSVMPVQRPGYQG